ncbi:Branched-chain amino acid transport protein (AzlD) [compost metagenome]
MDNIGHSIAIIAVVAITTGLLRYLPFLIFRDAEKVPNWVYYLGKVLPSALMAMLVVFCFRSINFLGGSHGVPEMIASVIVIFSYKWKKNTLLSLGVGTVIYMFLVQVIFI